jgi:hypothetical protein
MGKIKDSGCERAWCGDVLNPTFPGFPVLVGAGSPHSGILGSGKRAPRPQEAVETAGVTAAAAPELVALPASRRSSAGVGVVNHT